VPGDREIEAVDQLFFTEGIRVFKPGEEDFQGNSTNG
jgi:hypothetical protein